MYHQGRDYTMGKTGEKIFFRINGIDRSQNESFYKYYALNKTSVDALTHMYLYATHPCQLNDPLDCADDLIIFDDIESARIILEQYLARL